MEIKQVIIIRKDLNMRKGKIAAQASHASMKVFFDKLKTLFYSNGASYNEIYLTPEETNWVQGIFTKIVVSVNSEQELLDIYNKAKESNMLCSLIQDCGLTEFKGVPTYTAVAIGPAESFKINNITAHLSLL